MPECRALVAVVIDPSEPARVKRSERGQSGSAGARQQFFARVALDDPVADPSDSLPISGPFQQSGQFRRRPRTELHARESANQGGLSLSEPVSVCPLGEVGLDRANQPLRLGGRATWPEEFMLGCRRLLAVFLRGRVGKRRAGAKAGLPVGRRACA